MTRERHFLFRLAWDPTQDPMERFEFWTTPGWVEHLRRNWPTVSPGHIERLREERHPRIDWVRENSPSAKVIYETDTRDRLADYYVVFDNDRDEIAYRLVFDPLEPTSFD